jgi:hypothetical protein
MSPAKAIAITLLTAVCYGCSSYKFGIPEQNYPQYFGEQADGLNGVMKYNASYSWLTELPIDQDTIEVEHGTIATEEDIARVGLPAGCYLFFSINISTPVATEIRVTHNYDGEPLVPAGTFIFRQYRNQDGTLDKERPDWEVKPLGSDTLSERYPFGYVRMYELPAITCLSPEAFQFSSPLREQISIRMAKDGQNTQYDFDLILEWHKSSTLWWRILTIT